MQVYFLIRNIRSSIVLFITITYYNIFGKFTRHQRMQILKLSRTISLTFIDIVELIEKISKKKLFV